jgi:hypothetical protein
MRYEGKHAGGCLKVVLGVTGLLVAATLFLTGCGKALEPYNDAPVKSQNKTPADVLNMPDGFSNVATKCDHGNRVYVAFHGDKAYGAIAVVPNDPTCAGATAK